MPPLFIGELKKRWGSGFKPVHITYPTPALQLNNLMCQKCHFDMCIKNKISLPSFPSVLWPPPPIEKSWLRHCTSTQRFLEFIYIHVWIDMCIKNKISLPSFPSVLWPPPPPPRWKILATPLYIYTKVSWVHLHTCMNRYIFYCKLGFCIGRKQNRQVWGETNIKKKC